MTVAIRDCSVGSPAIGTSNFAAEQHQEKGSNTAQQDSLADSRRARIPPDEAESKEKDLQDI